MTNVQNDVTLRIFIKTQMQETPRDFKSLLLSSTRSLCLLYSATTRELGWN